MGTFKIIESFTKAALAGLQALLPQRSVPAPDYQYISVDRNLEPAEAMSLLEKVYSGPFTHQYAAYTSENPAKWVRRLAFNKDADVNQMVIAAVNKDGGVDTVVMAEAFKDGNILVGFTPMVKSLEGN